MILAATEENISKAAAVIRAGGVVAFPTETVYGLGANALSDAAVRSIYAVKERPRTNPLIVHIADFAAIGSVAQIENPETLRRLNALKAFWPGPLSVVLPKQPGISSIATAGSDTVAVRIPAHPCCQAIIKAAGVPIAAPSANAFAAISPTTAEHVAESLGDKIDLIIDGGPCRVGLESTVLSLVESTPRILRPGAVTKEQLTEALGEVHTEKLRLDEETPQLSPGLLKRHYAPKTPLRFRSNFDESNLPERTGLISFGEPENRSAFYRVLVLPEDDLSEAARNLFKALHELDHANLDLILVDRCNESGIGAAIMDRLNRAVDNDDTK
ncbi:MAG: threonylcarbamoyl-AMP synthase [Bdellovibrionales bacterium]|nr:threonylcarbamoyl-AMP synthase [Bdellovibrionales bacterium]